MAASGVEVCGDDGGWPELLVVEALVCVDEVGLELEEEEADLAFGGLAVVGCGEFLAAGEESSFDTLHCVACDCRRYSLNRGSPPRTAGVSIACARPWGVALAMGSAVAGGMRRGSRFLMGFELTCGSQPPSLALWAPGGFCPGFISSPRVQIENSVVEAVVAGSLHRPGSSSFNLVVSARQEPFCSHSNRPEIMRSSFIRVELGPPVRLWLIGLLLELLIFNDKLRGNLVLGQVKLTPKSTAQQLTSVLCRFRGGNRRGLSVCQAECTPNEAQENSRRGSAAAPCRHAPFSVAWLHQEDCFFSSVIPPFKRMASCFQLVSFGNVLWFIP
uniref:ZF-HD dimerization-type domain-containing protein n=1 Tax=Oryza barthii TaxID=65489 RepID=A0A0D3GKV8_9ORYZ